jgi:hypothetical protein
MLVTHLLWLAGIPAAIILELTLAIVVGRALRYGIGGTGRTD